MLINKELNGTELTVSIEGRLDTTTAPQLEAEFKNSLDNVKTLTVNMEKLTYISSAGLRVLLKAQKLMNKQGTMAIINVNPEIREIFEVTGFNQILNIK